MLTGRRIVTAEDEPFTAFDLVRAVEAARGEVVGPFSTVAVARAMRDVLSGGRVEGAILDVALADGEVTPLAHALFDHGATVVLHTASSVPDEIVRRHGKVSVCAKPMVSDRVVKHLAQQLNVDKPTKADDVGQSPSRGSQTAESDLRTPTAQIRRAVILTQLRTRSPSVQFISALATGGAGEPLGVNDV